MTCTKRWSDIPFGHRQPNHPGHCSFLHGHGWAIELTFAAESLDACGFVVDFGGLKAIKQYLDDHLDHGFVFAHSDPFIQSPAYAEMVQLGVIKPYIVSSPSAEGLAEHFFMVFGDMVNQQTQGRVRVVKCTVFEDAKNSASYGR